MPKLVPKRRVEEKTVKTHEGATVRKCGDFEQLKRSVLSCMLWEEEFYEDGKTITSRIADLIKKCDGQSVADLTVAARTKYKLRHTPLFMARESARNEKQRQFVADTLAKIVNRPDELSAFLALYWDVKAKTDRNGKTTGEVTMKKQPIAASVKKGLARAFVKFDEYDRENGVRTIKEVVLYEGSAVLWGANDMTPTLDVKALTKPQQQKNVYDRLERLKSAIRNGSFTDETFSLLEIEFCQLQKAVSEIEGTKKADEATKPPVDANLLKALEQFNNTLKNF